MNNRKEIAPGDWGRLWREWEEHGNIRPCYPWRRRLSAHRRLSDALVAEGAGENRAAVVQDWAESYGLIAIGSAWRSVSRSRARLIVRGVRERLGYSV